MWLSYLLFTIAIRLACSVNAWDDLCQTLDERFHVAELFDELIISADGRGVRPTHLPTGRAAPGRSSPKRCSLTTLVNVEVRRVVSS
jgi:hypothetical protein